jgi:hypothetical protein
MADRQDGAPDGIWFAPKRYGLGSGPPIAWQGWVVMGVYFALTLLVGVTTMPKHPGLFATLLVILTLGMSAIAALHTRGGWHWRWGGE